jgi:hypothetical protein
MLRGFDLRGTAGMNDNDNPEPIEFIELSPEQSALLRRQFELDREDTGPTLPVDAILYRGITLESRWSVASEFETMKAIVDALPNLVRARLESIWCDSNAQAWYTVAVAQGRWAEAIDCDVRDAVMSAAHGFNGLTVSDGDRHVAFDPDWAGDDDFGYDDEAAGDHS